MSKVSDLGNRKDFSELSVRRRKERASLEARGNWPVYSSPAAADTIFPSADGKYRIQMVGLGDVGQNVALGLTLMGAGLIENIGVFDLNEAQAIRMETELSQCCTPPGGKQLPKVYRAQEQQLFDCDVFLFCATKAVPAVGSGVKDVRMAQYEANRKIVSIYACMAAARKYQGLFLVVSDPVDLLCMEALRGSNLCPEQIRGCGLGVMNARGRFYAERVEELSAYLTTGRAFGPHGQDLVLANDVTEAGYDEEASRELTRLAVEANLRVRDLGFKPFLAPAMSSAVLTILAMLRGEWNYSATWMNGLYFGALNRQTTEGIRWEDTELASKLYERLEVSYRHLEKVLWP